MNKKTYYIKGMTCDGCRDSVQKALSEIPGVERALVDLEKQTAEIISNEEIPYKNIEISLRPTSYDVFKTLKEAQTYTYYVQGMTCAGCEETVLEQLKSIEGVKKVKVDLKNQKVEVQTNKFVPFFKLKKSLSNTHYQVFKTKDEIENVVAGQATEDNSGVQEWYCPMQCEGDKTYPENVGCPVCGMDLVPVQTSADEQDDSTYQNLLKKLWGSIAFTLPIFIIAMSEMIPNNPLYEILTQ